MHGRLRRASRCIGSRGCCTTSASRARARSPRRPSDYTFYNHETVGARMADVWLKRYRFSNDERERVVHLVRNHLVCYSDEWTDAAVRRFVRRVGRSTRRRPARPGARRRARQGARRDRGARRRCERLARAHRAVRARRAPRFGTRDLAIDGSDVMKRLGIPPGPLGRQGARGAATTRARAARAERARGAARGGRRDRGSLEPGRCGDRETSSSESPPSTRFVDLHCHYIPGIDDGVRTRRRGPRAVPGARARSATRTVAATPHIRSRDVRQRRRRPRAALRALRGRPRAAAEACPSSCSAPSTSATTTSGGCSRRGETLPYPGGKALLIELPAGAHAARARRALLPACSVRGRAAGARPPGALRAAVRQQRRRSSGCSSSACSPLLDLMSLVGKYGRKPRARAERMLEEGVYFAACSDCHRPADVELVARRSSGCASWSATTRRSSCWPTHPRAILRGEVER